MSILTENWHTCYIGGADSKSRLRFLKLWPQNSLLDKFALFLTFFHQTNLHFFRNVMFNFAFMYFHKIFWSKIVNLWVAASVPQRLFQKLFDPDHCSTHKTNSNRKINVFMSENIGQGRLNFFLEYFGAQY